jgi:hypothetical protein
MLSSATFNNATTFAGFAEPRGSAIGSMCTIRSSVVETNGVPTKCVLLRVSLRTREGSVGSAGRSIDYSIEAVQ